jgi:hypothetical protein
LGRNFRALRKKKLIAILERAGPTFEICRAPVAFRIGLPPVGHDWVGLSVADRTGSIDLRLGMYDRNRQPTNHNSIS